MRHYFNWQLRLLRNSSRKTMTFSTFTWRLYNLKQRSNPIMKRAFQIKITSSFEQSSRPLQSSLHSVLELRDLFFLRLLKLLRRLQCVIARLVYILPIASWSQCVGQLASQQHYCTDSLDSRLLQTHSSPGGRDHLPCS